MFNYNIIIVKVIGVGYTQKAISEIQNTLCIVYVYNTIKRLRRVRVRVREERAKYETMTRRGDGGEATRHFLYTPLAVSWVPVVVRDGPSDGWAGNDVGGATRMRAPAPLSNYHCRRRRHRRGWGRECRSSTYARARARTTHGTQRGRR